MRILQVCKKFPFPVKDGEGVAVRALAQGMREAGCTVDLLSFNTSKHHIKDPQEADLPHYDSISTCDLENDVTLLEAGISLFKKGSYHVNRFENEAFKEILRNMLQKNSYDAVILETNILALYIPIIRLHSDAAVIIRAHNLEHEIWSRISTRGNIFLRPAYKIFARRLKRFEKEWINKADLILPITARDGEQFLEDLGCTKPMHIVPVGYDSQLTLEPILPPLSQLPFAISFIGSLDWAPNQEGLKWFLKDVWPLLNENFPSLEFHIAGRKTPPEILNLKMPKVFVHGEVDDSAIFLSRFPMTVAPILSGSGTRVKILDAMVTGRVVLTTQMGLEGIQAQDRKQVLICRSPTAFVDQVRFVKENPEMLLQIGENARSFIRNNFDFARIGYGVASAIRDQKRAKAKVVN